MPLSQSKRYVITVAIIGAGPLGRRLALGAARAGFRVFLEDVMPGTLHHAREPIRQELGPEALPAVAFVSTIEDAVREADLVIDCVPDELESKLEILWLVDRMAPPRTVIATPTTNLSIADLASCTNRPEKCIAIADSPQGLAACEGPDLVLRTAPVTSEETVSAGVRFLAAARIQPQGGRRARRKSALSRKRRVAGSAVPGLKIQTWTPGIRDNRSFFESSPRDSLTTTANVGRAHSLQISNSRS